MLELRDYQLAAVEGAETALNAGETPLMVLPTGAGKTVTFSEIIRRHIERDPGSRVLVLAHRIELLHQAARTIRTVVGDAVTIGYEAASVRAGDAQIVCGSTATLRTPSRRPGGVGLVIVDEAHRIQSNTHGSIVTHYTAQGARLMGVTATPERLDGKPLGEFFSTIAYKMGLQEAIERGFLVPVVSVGIGTELDTAGLRVRTGDYVDGDVSDKLEPLCGQIAQGLAERVGDEPGIVFAATVRSAQALADAMNEQGLHTRVLVGTTPAKDRAQIVEDYAAGRLQAISSVAALVEGFDAPLTRWVLMARPTKSKTLYRQAVGRAMRPAPGKQDAWLIDLFNSTTELSIAGRKRLLEGRVRRDEKKPQACAADLFDDVEELTEQVRADVDVERLAKVRMAGRRADLGLSSRYVWSTAGEGRVPVLKVGDAAWVALLERRGVFLGAYLGPEGKRKLGEWVSREAARDAVEDGVYDTPRMRKYADRVARNKNGHGEHRALVAMEAAAVFGLA